MAYTSTLKAVLAMDTSPFDKGLSQADRRMLEFANNSKKSARESAAVFEEIARQESALMSARVQQAEQSNRAITAGQDRVTKSARESAAAFEAAFAAQEKSATAPVAGQSYGPRGVSQGAVGMSRELNQNLAKSDGMLSKIMGKFSAGSILSSVLTGAGIGTGFALAQKAADLIASHWERAAEAATKIYEASTRMVDANIERMGLRNTPEQQLKLGRQAEQSAETRALAAGYRGDDVAQAEALAEAAEHRLANEKLIIEIEKKAAAARKKALEEEKERRERDLQLQIAAGERKRADQEAEAARQKEISEARAEANRLEKQFAEKQLDTIAQLNAAEEEMLTIQEHLNELDEGSLKYEQTRQDLAAAGLKVADLRAKMREEERRKEEAINNILKARTALAAANRDRAAFGVDDAATGGRGTIGEQRTARRIRDIERRARKAYDRGDRVTESRDQRGNIIRETGEQESARLLGEADALRGGLGNRLNSAERDPLKAYKEALAESEKSLREIAERLAPESVS